MGCVGVLVVLFVIGLVVMFFEWLGGRISVRVGPELMPLASALLVVWLGGAITAGWIGSSRQWSGAATYAPIATWAVTMFLIMFLPSSLGVAPMGAEEPSVAAPEDVAVPLEATVPEFVVEDDQSVAIEPAPYPEQDSPPALEPSYDQFAAPADVAEREIPVRSEPETKIVQRPPAIRPESSVPVSLPIEVDRKLVGRIDENTDVVRYVYQCSNGRNWYVFNVISSRNTTFLTSPHEAGYLSGKKFDTHDNAVASLCQGR